MMKLNATDHRVLQALGQSSAALNATSLTIATGAGYSTVTASLRRLIKAGEIMKDKNGGVTRTKKRSASAYTPKGIAALVMRKLARASEPLTAYALGVALERSGGAVKNACDRLVAEGLIRRTGNRYAKKGG